jgi:Fibronectin type III domain
MNKKRKKQCAMAKWSSDGRKRGLQFLDDITRDLQEEHRIQTLTAKGKPPQAPRLWDGSSSGHDDGSYSAYDEIVAASSTEILVCWAPASEKGDYISFFSLEFGGPITAGKHADYQKIFQDPEESEPHAEFSFCFRLRDLQPGTSYAFRVRAVNGFGPGDYTYRVFTTRPEKVPRPKIIGSTIDTVVLRWNFSSAFYQRMAELEHIFYVVDSDKSGAISRYVRDRSFIIIKWHSRNMTHLRENT